ncbi:DUF7507 domain-containing protein [Candidatus Protochlamydia sp. W-9]|uniref:DUF7507 domain-containing protein n=1 Tax=Candidatus Protochlamydia sp. W-9 TaxID=1785087 RepID=UPI00096A729D|nr:hypothetical protein [Candidatus Protochlamydia sp. W-9]
MKAYFIYPTKSLTFLLFWISLFLNQYLSASTSALETNHPLLDSKSYLEQEEPFILTINADIPSFVKVGQVIGYTFIVSTTSSTQTYTNVTVSCPLLEGDILLDQTTVKIDQPATGMGEYVVTQYDIDLKEIVCGAIAGGDTSNDNTAVANSSITLPFLPLNLIKKANPTLFSAVGELITYTYQLTNLGDEEIESIKIEDNKIPFVSLPSTTLFPNQSLTTTASYVVTESDILQETITNTAIAQGINLNLNLVNSNEVLATVTLNQNQVILPPRSLHGYRTSNRFVNQTDYIDVLQWKLPLSGESPIGYKIFSDENLKKLVAKIPYNTTEYYIHNRRKQSSYTYYIVSVDQFGRVSLPISVKIKP